MSEPPPPLPREVANALRTIAGRESVLTEPADCWPYGYDNSRRQALPRAVVFATEHAQVRDLVRLCNGHGIGLIARGRGTGTTGATVPLDGGIVLSLERMERILEIDPANRIARVEPGVTNDALQQAAAAHGFFWPPDPTSAAACTVGGNLAYNSAGPRAVKYGTPRENTLGLRAVTGQGEEIRTGVITSKGVVGYDLTRLIIGSEGTLAIITEAVLKLTPRPEARRTLRAGYGDIHAAARAVSAIMAQPVTPCALEFMDGASLGLVRRHEDPGVAASVGAVLIIEVDGPAHCIDEAARAVQDAARVDGCIEVRAATSDDEVARLWRVRKALSPALRNAAPKKINEDVVVPVSRIPDLVGWLEALSREEGVSIVNFGHAGNGNIHVNILIDPSEPAQVAAGERCLSALFDRVLELGGTLSGEHGIGLEKRDFVDREIDPVTLGLMRAIKRQFDPNAILNPGKGLPPA
ncbi:MAG: FAD-linked oxidase C-terminal domain-containing protein [Chromatiales bacterium]|jgi:D-lactate dehydrogenase